jgi:hypothetical protein
MYLQFQLEKCQNGVLGPEYFWPYPGLLYTVILPFLCAKYTFHLIVSVNSSSVKCMCDCLNFFSGVMEEAKLSADETYKSRNETFVLGWT